MKRLSNEAIVEKDGMHVIVLHPQNWIELDIEMRHSLLLDYAKEWNRWEGEPGDDSIASHLADNANRFPIQEGSNCLAATLFAVTGNEQIVHQWVHPETFLQTLKRSGYETVKDDEPRSNDVLTYWNDQGQLVHASYCVRQGLYFNKHGQVRFNPWKLINHDELMEHWGAYRLQIERRL